MTSLHNEVSTNGWPDVLRLRFFVLRNHDGEVYVYSIRHYGNAYHIADISWDRPFMTCVDFGPDASGNQLLEGGKIRCHDARMSDWPQRELVWDYSGKSMGGEQTICLRPNTKYSMACS